MKRRSRLKIKIFDENHLVEKGGFRFSWIWFSLISLCVAVIFVLVGMAIIWFSPLKSRLPGYMPVQQRGDTEIAVMQLDSLEAVYRINQAYIDNIATILNTDRPATVTVDTLSAALPLELDSLVLPSQIELEFVRKMEDAGYVIAAFNNIETNDSTR